MFCRGIFIIFFLSNIWLNVIDTLPTPNIKRIRNLSSSTDTPHQPAVPPILEKDILKPTPSLLDIAKNKKYSTVSPANIQTQIFSFS